MCMCRPVIFDIIFFFCIFLVVAIETVRCVMAVAMSARRTAESATGDADVKKATNGMRKHRLATQDYVKGSLTALLSTIALC